MKVLKETTYRLYRIQKDGSLLDCGMRTEKYFAHERPIIHSSEWRPEKTLETALEERTKINDEFESLVDQACEGECNND